MKEIVITVDNTTAMKVIEALMSVNVTQFTVQTPSQETATVTTAAVPLDFSTLKEKSKKRVIHRSSVTSTDIVLDVLKRAVNNQAPFSVIQRAILNHGYANNTVNAAISKLKMTGVIVKVIEKDNVYWKLVNDR